MKQVFGENLSYWLKAEGRKQTWLAEKLGVDRVLIYRWKRGEVMPSPNSEHLYELAELMNLPNVACLFIEDGVKDPAGALQKLIDEISRKP